MKGLVQGVGINDADYTVVRSYCVEGITKKSTCPFYRKWCDMLVRCYSKKEQKRNPNYIGCTVCDEWLTFSNFKKWMETQDWEGKQLDKDILIKGNKHYSPETSVFIHQKVNKFTTDHASARGKYLIGVHLDRASGKFVAQCGNPFTGKQENLGKYDSEIEAHQVWKNRKHYNACMLADSGYVTDERVRVALRIRYL